MVIYNLLASVLIFLVLAIIAAVVIRSKKLQQSSAWKLPPGPAKLAVIGNLHQLGQNLHQSFWKLSQQHGPLMYLKLGNVPTVVVSSSELAKQVLKTHDLECCSRPHLVALAKITYGCSDISFGPYGENWKELRKICVTELLNNKKIYLFRGVREKEVKQMIRSIASYASNSLPVNLSETLSTLNCNIICRIAFGKSYAKDLAHFHDTFRESEALLGGLFMADYIPVLGWVIDVLTGMHGRLERSFVKFDQFCQRLIDDHLDDAIRKQKDNSEEDILDALLRMQKDNKHLTEQCIRGVLVDILFAGTETSSATIGWAMTELMRHPELMKKATDEVRGCLGTKRMVEESDLDKLYYLKAIIKETMRKHPPTPLLLPRETMQHLTLNGYDIPAKTRLIVNSWAIGRDPSSWKNPDDFNPERFIELGDHDFKFIPFGEGRRICPGKNLGLVIIEHVLANLLYCFDWHLPSGMTKEDIDLDEATGITVFKKSAIWLVPSISNEIEV